MAGQIDTIYIASAHGQDQQPVSAATLAADRGLQGDRYDGSGIVSLIEREAVDAFNSDTGLNVDAASIRRNIVTQGIALNDLVGKRFRVGEAELEGTELCEPCAILGKLLSSGEVTPAAVVRQFATSAGIRARVISTGTIAPGDSVG